MAEPIEARVRLHRVVRAFEHKADVPVAPDDVALPEVAEVLMLSTARPPLRQVQGLSGRLGQQVAVEILRVGHAPVRVAVVRGQDRKTAHPRASDARPRGQAPTPSPPSEKAEEG